MRIRAAGAIFIGIMIYSTQGFAEVSVNIGIGVPLPRVVIHSPPPVVVIPGTYVYFAPDVELDMFFYQDRWYRPHNGHWYRAKGYNGPWSHIKIARVPHVLRDLPPRFHHDLRHHERIRHADLRKNWKGWEQKKHWDKHHGKHEVRKDRNDGRRESDQNRNRGNGKHEK